jgi:DNA-binding transcriptional LysR family regulator
MDIYQIRYFLAVVDAGNFSRAAERVHVTQPTLSTGVKKLEDELGVALFERDNRVVKLTAAGEQFLQRARTIYREMERAKDEMKAARAPAVLRIGLLNTMPMEPVVNLIHDFRKLHPEVFIELLDGADEDLRARLRLDRIDLAITALRSDDKASVSQVIIEEALYMAVNRAHPLARKRSISLNEAHERPFIERINCDVWAALRDEFERHGVQPRSVCRTENDQSTLSMIAAGLGISIMPIRPNTQGVAFIPIENLTLKRKIGLLWQDPARSLSLERFCLYAEQCNRLKRI